VDQGRPRWTKAEESGERWRTERRKAETKWKLERKLKLNKAEIKWRKRRRVKYKLSKYGVEKGLGYLGTEVGKRVGIKWGKVEIKTETP
jgi:hypothetical protein